MADFVPIFNAEVEKGKLQFDDRLAFQIWLEGLEGNVEVIVRKRKRRRTDKQNNFYWAYLNLVQEETGTPAEDTHELVKRMFLPRIEKTIFGKKLAFPQSTTTLTTKEFTDYMAKIAELTGVPVPDKNKVSAE